MATACGAAAPIASPAPAASTSAPQDSDPAQELFEIYDDSGRLLGTEARGVVHVRGLLHKCVYVWVFDRKGRLLVQRRAKEKKIGPGQWDLSVAEHLSPGESFRDAAQRGLAEELGIQGAVLPQRPVVPVHRRTLVVPGLYVDNELVESYRLDGFEGEVRVNPFEVEEVKFISLGDLAEQMAAQPEDFTEWFRDEAHLLLHGAGGAAAAAGDPELN